MKRTILFFALAAFLCLFTIKAQAQSSLHRYLQDNEDAIEYIGNMAHPAQDVLDVEYVRGSSSYIDVRIKFESLMRNYWEPYRINLRQRNGFTYAFSIERTSAVSIYEPFIALDWTTSLVRSLAANVGYSTSDSAEAIRILYDTSESNLSKNQKAAIMLMNYIYD